MFQTLKGVSEDEDELQGIRNLFVMVAAEFPAYLIGLAHWRNSVSTFW